MIIVQGINIELVLFMIFVELLTKSFLKVELI